MQKCVDEAGLRQWPPERSLGWRLGAWIWGGSPTPRNVKGGARANSVLGIDTCFPPGTLGFGDSSDWPLRKTRGTEPLTALAGGQYCWGIPWKPQRGLRKPAPVPLPTSFHALSL